MQRKKKTSLFRKFIVMLAVITIAVAIILCYRHYGVQFKTYGFAREVPEAEQILRTQLVETAMQWIGSNETDGTHKPIIDLYNQNEPLAQGYLVQYDDQWCATFVSAAAIEAGYTQIIPTECGCQRQIELFQKLGSWEEADDHIPLPGDIIYYCRTENGLNDDCTGWSDHVGIVVGTNGNTIKVIEGNYGDRVGYRYITANAQIIRGYALPDYSQLCP